MNEMIEQLIWMMILPLPVACIAWTITHEEIFREPREWMVAHSRSSQRWWARKFWYALTCEYCFSHYLSAGMVVLADYRLLIPDWRGYLISWFAIVAIANVYLSAYGRLRVEIHKERAEAQESESRTKWSA